MSSETSRYQANQEGISTTKWLIQWATQPHTRVSSVCNILSTTYIYIYSLNTQVVTTNKWRPQN